MNQQTRQSLITRYKEGYGAVTNALHAATDAELNARPAPDKWSAREIVHHLADSEMQAAFRLRHMLASDAPLIVAYDQDEFARQLHYERPIASSLAVFKAARESTAELLDRMSDSDWSRSGRHPDHPEYGVEEWLTRVAAHAHAHADQIRRARASLKRD